MFNKRLIILTIITIIYIMLPVYALANNNVSYNFERLWPTFQQPWSFSFPCGISKDNLGNIYIASRDSESVQKYTSEGKYITAWGGYGKTSAKFSGIYDIASGWDNQLFISDNNTNLIQKFDQNGNFILQWGGKGTIDGKFDCASGIAVDYSLNVYVADLNNNRIQYFTNDGQYLSAWGSYGSSSGMFNKPSDIAIDNDNFIYIADSKNHRIQKFNSSHKFILSWGSYGNENGQFDTPVSLFSYKNFIFVVDENNHRIQKFTNQGDFVLSFGVFGEKDGQFNEPFDLTISNDIIYISDKANNRIQLFTVNGKFLTYWGRNSEQFYEFFDMDIDSSDNIYLTDQLNHCVHIFDSNGNFTKKLGHYGKGEGNFWYPSGIAVYKNNIYVSDCHNRIQQFDLLGNFINQWGRLGNDSSQFNNPQSIAADIEGNIFVADTFNHRIQKFTKDGIYITKWGQYGFEPGFFSEPKGLAIDSKNNLYVTDQNNNRIQIFSEDGQFLNIFQISSEYKLNYPSKLAIDQSDNIYIADTYNNEIKKFDQSGLLITKWGKEGINPGYFDTPHSLDISKNGKVYVADTLNHRVQVFKNSTTPEYKAIIVAGGGLYAGNNLWQATQMCANFVYRSLIYQGLTRDNIQYLSSDTNVDINGNGLFDDIDTYSDLSELEKSILDWAKGSENLIIYLVDHGGFESFRMNDKELLYAANLDLWLDQLQNESPVNIVLIYDACKSGSFINKLSSDSNHKRIVITSSLSDENAYFISHGFISFSGYFWTNIFNGSSIYDSFEAASKALFATKESQTPAIDANGNGIINEIEDKNLTKDLFIGNGTKIYGDIPVIGEISPSQTISYSNSAAIYAKNVFDNDGIAKVWAVIWPPEYDISDIDNPINSLPKIDLLPLDNGNYEGVYDNFNIYGTYNIAIYAMDNEGNTSIPELTDVTFMNPMTKKAIIIVGQSQSYTLNNAFSINGELAYNALNFQGYSDEDIFYIDSTKLETSSSMPVTMYIIDALNTAKGNTKDLLIYIIGTGSQGQFQLRNNENLTSNVFDNWLDEFQTDNSILVSVIVDLPFSQSFISQLTPTSNNERILISSTKNTNNYFLADGNISFSSFFWRQIINGAGIKNAFNYASAAIRYAIPEQIPCLDDNGNGIVNEPGIDGKLSSNYIVGFGIMLASNDPVISSVSPEQCLTNTTQALIYANFVTSTKEIDKVWATLSPPVDLIKLITMDSNDLKIFELNKTQNNTYEIILDDFKNYGTYEIAIFAKDIDGNISYPAHTKVIQKSCPDIFENDNEFEKAGIIILNSIDEIYKRHHNFHEDGDVDWVRFFGKENVAYTIEITDIETNCLPFIELFNENKESLIDPPVNMAEMSCFSWKCPLDGEYFLKISNYSNLFGQETGYSLKIHDPSLAFPGFISGMITCQTSGKPIANVRVETNRNSSALSDDEGIYVIFGQEGWHTLKAFKENYKKYEKKIRIFPLDETPLPFEMFPIDIDNDGIPDELEKATGTQYTNNDSDGDNIPDGIEDYNKNGIVDEGETDPRVWDTDFDGFPDGWETDYDFEPLKPDDQNFDTDQDGYSNFIEFKNRTNPYQQDEACHEGYNPQTDKRQYILYPTMFYEGCRVGQLYIEIYQDIDKKNLISKIPVDFDYKSKSVDAVIPVEASCKYYVFAFLDSDDNSLFDEYKEPSNMIEIDINGTKYKNIELQTPINNWNMSLSNIDKDNKLKSEIIKFDMNDDDCDDVYLSSNALSNSFEMTGLFIKDHFFSTIKYDHIEYKGKGAATTLGLIGRSKDSNYLSPYSAIINPEIIPSPDLKGFCSITFSYEGYKWDKEENNGSQTKIINFKLYKDPQTDNYMGFTGDDQYTSSIVFAAQGNNISYTFEKYEQSNLIYHAIGTGIFRIDMMYNKVIGTFAGKNTVNNGFDLGHFYARFTPEPNGAVSVGSPPPIVYSDAKIKIPVMIDTGENGLGTYSASIEFDNQLVKITDVVGMTYGFQASSIIDMNNSGLILISDSDSNFRKNESGVIHVADLDFQVIGPPGGAGRFQIKDFSISDVNSSQINLDKINGTFYVGPAIVNIGSVEPTSIFYDKEIDIPVSIEKAYNLKIAQYEIKIQFEPELLDAIDVSGGQTEGFYHLDDYYIDNTNGFITLKGNNDSTLPSSGHIDIAHIKFISESLANEETSIALTVKGLTNTNNESIGNYSEGAKINLLFGQCGDVNLDEKVDIADAMTISKYLVGDVDVSQICLDVADTNSNGRIDIGDSMFIVQYLFNNRECICYDIDNMEMCRD